METRQTFRRMASSIRERRFVRSVRNADDGLINLIDVGSCGAPPPPWRRHPESVAKLLAVDPRGERKSEADVEWFDVALWSENCMRELYIYSGKGGSGSSLFEQDVDYVAENLEELARRGSRRLARSWFRRAKLVGVERIECRTLDSILASVANVEYDFLKVDGQGAEYEVLLGSRRFLQSRCLGVQVELFNLPLYKGIKLKPTVVEFLRNLGYDLVRTYAPHGTFGSQEECVFLRDDHSEDKKLDGLRQLFGV